MMEWIKRWLRRFLGYCPNCGKVTSRSTATQGAVPYETEGTKWTCNACGWYRIWWEDDSAEEKWPGEDVKLRDGEADNSGLRHANQYGRRTAWQVLFDAAIAVGIEVEQDERGYSNELRRAKDMLRKAALRYKKGPRKGQGRPRKG